VGRPPMTAGCRSTRTSHAPAQRSSSVPGPAGTCPRTHGPMLPGAAVQIANGALSRVEQTKRFAIGQTHIRWILRPNYWHPDAGEGTGLLIALRALRECKHPYCGSTGVRRKGGRGVMAGPGPVREVTRLDGVARGRAARR